MRARFRFEYVSNAETCRKFPRRNRGTRRRPRELTRFGGTHFNASALKRTFAAEGSHGRVSQSSLSSYARSIVTSYLIRAFLSLSFFFFFIFATTLYFPFFLTRSLSIIVSRKLFSYFSTDYQLREFVSPSLYVSFARSAA